MKKRDTIFKKILRAIFPYLYKYNIYNLKEGSYISNKSKIIFSNLRGKVWIGDYVTIRKARISGVVSIKEGTKIMGGEVIISGKVNIGKYTSLNGPNTDLYSKINPINIGNFCSIARSVSIQEYNHNYKSISTYFINQNILKNGKNDTYSNGSIDIKNDVWIGAQVVILSGVTIGNGAIVSANSTVTKDVPDFAIVGGTPAKILGYRFNNEIIEKLKKIRWWDWPINKIKENEFLFEGNITLEKLKRIK